MITINIEKFLDELEKVEDKKNDEEEVVRNLLEYASQRHDVIDYDLFKDVPTELIERAISEVDKMYRDKSSEVLEDMVLVQHIKNNAENITSSIQPDDEDFF